MSDARTAILDRIDTALRTGRIPAAAPASEAPPALEPASSGGVQPSDLRERFAAEARALGIDVFLERSPEAVRDRLASLTSGQRVLSWNRDQLPYDAGDVIDGALPGSAPRSAQAAAEVGVTGCHGAIAETGSLALISKPGCSRSASLLPALHIALVHPRDLVFGMGEFFAARAADIAAASNLTFVTGPSRTADIELSLTIGVHGPARVVIIIGPE
jgi:L-lactate dehydrogenase complex protein LldG